MIPTHKHLNLFIVFTVPSILFSASIVARERNTVQLAVAKQGMHWLLLASSVRRLQVWMWEPSDALSLVSLLPRKIPLMALIGTEAPSGQPPSLLTFL